MKRKILALGLLSLSMLALFAGPGDAFWPCFRCHRYTTHITCRPYNAFTPICWGNLTCDGCCPSPCGVAGGCMPMQCGMPSFAGGCGVPHMAAYAPSYSNASDMPARQPMPDIRNQPYVPPAPMPMPLPNAPGAMMYPPSGVSQANYYPMYMPQYPNYYMPTYYNPYQGYQPMPYYWYNGQ